MYLCLISFIGEPDLKSGSTFYLVPLSLLYDPEEIIHIFALHLEKRRLPTTPLLCPAVSAPLRLQNKRCELPGNGPMTTLTLTFKTVVIFNLSGRMCKCQKTMCAKVLPSPVVIERSELLAEVRKIILKHRFSLGLLTTLRGTNSLRLR